jgi:hypothetical protein
VLGFRPESAKIDAEGPLAGRVVLDAFHGSCRYVHVEGTFGRVAVRTPPGPSRGTGDSVRIAIEPSAMRFFDAGSGKRVA